MFGGGVIIFFVSQETEQELLFVKLVPKSASWLFCLSDRMGCYTHGYYLGVFLHMHKDAYFKIQRLGIIQAMVMQAFTKHYIILFLNNFNSCLQTVIIVNIAFGRFSMLIPQFLGDTKVPHSEQVIITFSSVKILLVSML